MHHGFHEESIQLYAISSIFLTWREARRKKFIGMREEFHSHETQLAQLSTFYRAVLSLINYAIKLCTDTGLMTLPSQHITSIYLISDGNNSSLMLKTCHKAVYVMISDNVMYWASRIKLINNVSRPSQTTWRPVWPSPCLISNENKRHIQLPCMTHKWYG